mmetsp:Transcript_9340/g.27202  ORF Transcript_9340/g.27202 Transcript_9340/m.27202 type:complete len:523 (-) Transcript_9340:218-1786(-)
MGAEGDDYHEEEEEYRRQEWVKYYVESGDYASARSLGWDGEPLGAGAKGSAPPTTRPISDEDAAAVRIQSRYKAWSRTQKYKDERDEAARLQWIEYFVATKQYDAARQYGWDGTVPSTETERAATMIQSRFRGHREREDYKDVRDEAARQQWVAYYVKRGEIGLAMEYGYQPASIKVPKVAVARAAEKKRQSALVAKQAEYGNCLDSITSAIIPRKVKRQRQIELESALLLQRCARGMLARARARLRQREALLEELVNRQEERHAKRIEYYINMFLVQRERNAAFHQKASKIQAGYRGRRGRIVSRQRYNALEEEKRRRREEEEREERRREEERKREAELAAQQRQPVSFAQDNVRAGDSGPIASPRPVEISDGMSVQDINVELERGAQVAARQMADRRRAAELARRTMQSTRGMLKKTSPHARIPLGHKRFFYFEADNLCWRKNADDDDDEPNRKFIPVINIESVQIIDPLDKNEFALKVRGDTKAYKLRASSQRELMQWVQALKTILAVNDVDPPRGGRY